MLNLDKGALIQAFPINEKTIIGTLTNQIPEERNIIQADELITVTIEYDLNYVVFEMYPGECISIDVLKVISITTDGLCKFS